MADPSEVLELHMRATREAKEWLDRAQEYAAKGESAKARDALAKAREISGQLQRLENEVRPRAPF